MVRRTTVAVVAVTLATTFVPGCADDDPEHVTTTMALEPGTLPAAPNQVRLTGAGPEPATVEVRAGETFTFVNADTREHWLLTRHGEAINSATLRPGNSYAVTIAEPGRYEYRCTFHDEESGVVVVHPAEGPAT